MRRLLRSGCPDPNLREGRCFLSGVGRAAGVIQGPDRAWDGASLLPFVRRVTDWTWFRLIFRGFGGCNGCRLHGSTVLLHDEMHFWIATSLVKHDCWNVQWLFLLAQRI